MPFSFSRSTYHEYFNDFDSYTAGDWTITTTEAGAGDATEAISNATNGVLLITNATPLAVTDGIYFRKDDGDANIDFVVVKDSTATTQTAATTLSDDTWTTLTFHYDGSGSDIEIFKDGVSIGASVLTNGPDDEELTISFGIQNGEAVAKTLSIDYIHVLQER
jgi:hypothetical protein